MTTKATINAGLAGGDRSAGLDRFAASLYERPRPIMVVAELVPVDRTEPLDDASKKDPVVRLRIEQLEVAPTGEQDEVLRKVTEVLHLARTAAGTLTAEDDVALAEQTMSTAAGLMSGHEVARLRVILDWLLDHIDKVVANEKHRDADRRRLIREALAKAAAARDAGVQLDLEGSGR